MGDESGPASSRSERQGGSAGRHPPAANELRSRRHGGRARCSCTDASVSTVGAACWRQPVRGVETWETSPALQAAEASAKAAARGGIPPPQTSCAAGGTKVELVLCSGGYGTAAAGEHCLSLRRGECLPEKLPPAHNPASNEPPPAHNPASNEPPPAHSPARRRICP
jgi:hypothetical protein